MSRPRLLDAYCCEGGAARGYDLAGFDVFGVDLFKHTNDKGQRVGFSQARYPYPSHQGDAVEFIKAHGHEFDAIHASPPCQHASAGTRAMRAHGKSDHPALVEPTRDALIATGKPYVIENVKGAALLAPIVLCWSMFRTMLEWDPDERVSVRMERHRLFESNVPISAPAPCHHPAEIQVAGSYGAAQRTIAGAKIRGGGYVPSKALQERLLGIDWMTERGLHQSLPPVYTRHIGRQLLEAIS